jgi:N-acetylmuramoyl-L-alanine amidase
MYYRKIIHLLLLVLALNIMAPIQLTYAASAPNSSAILSALTSTTAPNGTGSLSALLSLLFDKILGPILNIAGNQSSSAVTENITRPPAKPPASSAAPVQASGALRGKVIVVDPGHGGSNPGAVANGVQEADINLAVSLKLRDQLQKAGATVIMTRQADSMVAPAGSTNGQDLAARVEMAEANQADLFIAVHSNDNEDSQIAGTMTFFPSGKSDELAATVQSAVVSATNAVDKGTSPATFYVLSQTSMPSILIEMGFVSNPAEAARLNADDYQSQLALGIFNGIAQYLTNR